VSPASSGADWERDFEKALARAKDAAAGKDSGRMLLLFFTGPDKCEQRGCAVCARYEKVFSEQRFRQYAKEKLVLVKVRFPKAKLDAPEEREYRKLKTRFGVKTYPKVELADSFGNPLPAVALPRDGAKVYVQNLEIMRVKELGANPPPAAPKNAAAAAKNSPAKSATKTREKSEKPEKSEDAPPAK